MLLQRRSNAISCLSITTALGLTVLTVVAQTLTAIKIDSVADKYALQDFSFEVSPETGRAGIRLEYTYPPARLGGDDSDRGPAPKIATLPGLTYDSTAHAVIYDGGTKRTTCATAVDRRNALFGRASGGEADGAAWCYRGQISRWRIPAGASIVFGRWMTYSKWRANDPANVAKPTHFRTGSDA